MDSHKLHLKASIAAWVMAAVLLAPRSAPAHPLGNFSVSHYTAIRLYDDRIDLRYVVDMAEIPTFQEIQESGIVPEARHPSLANYVARKAESFKERLWLEVNGRRLVLDTVSKEVIFPPGAGGLPTLKLGIRYRAKLHGAVHSGDNDLRYRDGNFLDRAGWKEIIAAAEHGVPFLSSSVPAQDRSGELSDYPTDLLNSPPQDIEAHISFIWKTPAVASGKAAPPPAKISAGMRPIEPVTLQPNRQTTPRSAFTELIAAKQMSVGIVVMAFAVALVLGGLHALEPGHGKTMVAAYLVGSRGTVRHAVLLGLIVTASHTAGVYILGGVTFYASKYVLAESLYPWIGFASGLTVAALGIFLFMRRYKEASAAHDHTHHHHHGHDHSGDSHVHAEFHHHSADEPHPTVSLRELWALGITGGIIPCPAALVVLLSALSLRRVGFGLMLIVAFSVGLAVVLVAIGILMVYARRLMTRLHADGPVISRWLPLASSAVVTFLGIAIAVQALANAGIFRLQLS